MVAMFVLIALRIAYRLFHILIIVSFSRLVMALVANSRLKAAL